jgi:hypothetical protein
MVIYADFPGISIAWAPVAGADKAGKPAIYRGIRWIATGTAATRAAHEECGTISPDRPHPLVRGHRADGAGGVIAKAEGRSEQADAMASTTTSPRRLARRRHDAGRGSLIPMTLCVMK